MRHFRHWPILGGCTLAAVMLGVHLGDSAIGLIKPIHFQGPAPHPRERGAAIEEPLPAPVRASYHDAYGWDEGRSALAGACGDCMVVTGPAVIEAGPAYSAGHSYSAVVPYFGGSARPRLAVGYEPLEADHASAMDEGYADRQSGEGGPEVTVHRYAYYPVSEDEVAAAELDAPQFDKPLPSEPLEPAY